MTNNKGVVDQMKDNVTESSRNIWLAGLGLLSTAEEEGTKLFNSFVERGQELVEKGEAYEKQDHTMGVREKADDAVKFVESRLHAVIEQFGFSSRNDIKELNEKIDKLNRTISNLVKRLDQQSKA